MLVSDIHHHHSCDHHDLEKVNYIVDFGLVYHDYMSSNKETIFSRH
jgi:hypothetical protein